MCLFKTMKTQIFIMYLFVDDMWAKLHASCLKLFYDEAQVLSLVVLLCYIYYTIHDNHNDAALSVRNFRSLVSGFSHNGKMMSYKWHIRWSIARKCVVFFHFEHHLPAFSWKYTYLILIRRKYKYIHACVYMWILHFQKSPRVDKYI